MNQPNRSEINQALSKSLAYKASGKDALADMWAGKLVELLRDAGINPAAQLPTPSQSSRQTGKPKSSQFDTFFSV